MFIVFCSLPDEFNQFTGNRKAMKVFEILFQIRFTMLLCDLRKASIFFPVDNHTGL